MSRNWDSEGDAMTLLEALLGGTRTRIDPGGGKQQLHDYDLTLPDGRTIAVEVTRHNLPAALRSRAEIERRSWYCEGLNRRWWLKPVATVNAKRLHSQVGPLLSQLEAAGVEELHLVTRRFFGDPAGIPPASQPQRLEMDRTGTLETGRSLYELGVRMVYTVEPTSTSPGEVVVNLAAPGRSTGASVIVAAAEHHANLPDNASKLRSASGRAERHLFVWAEHSRFELVAALDDAGRGVASPEVAPIVADFVDAIWLATACSPSAVWCYERDGGWVGHRRVDWK